LGQAEGNMALLMKQAEGLKSIMLSTGGDANNAAMLMIVDKLPALVATQVEAIKNLKIDKITVWDTGRSENGENTTAGFLKGLAGSLPPIHELMESAGVKLPGYLGEKMGDKKTEPKK
jgi:flotillin